MQRDERRRRGVRGSVSRGIFVVLGLAAIGGCVAWWGIASRAKAMTALTGETRELNTPTVSVTRPKPGSPEEQVLLPGSLQAFADESRFDYRPPAVDAGYGWVSGDL
jgi:hypothetical protein